MEHIYEEILPEGFYLDDLLIDNQTLTDFNYENYLRELINQSAWFMKKTGGEYFIAPADESHGENDAITKAYSIDFKRILGESALRNRHFSGKQLVRCTDGVVYEFKGSIEKSETLVKVHEALRDMEIGELRRLGKRSRASVASELEKDIIAYLHVISREKNLLLYYPAEFSVAGAGTEPEAAGKVGRGLREAGRGLREAGWRLGAVSPAERADENAEHADVVIARQVYEDYHTSLEYRRELAPDYETYICLFCDADLLIMQYAADALHIVDRVRAMGSPTFRAIARYYNTVEYPVMGAFR